MDGLMDEGNDSWGSLHFSIETSLDGEDLICSCYFTNMPYLYAEIFVPGRDTHHRVIRKQVVQSLKNTIIQFKEYVCGFCDKGSNISKREPLIAYHGNTDGSYINTVCKELFKSNFRENRSN